MSKTLYFHVSAVLSKQKVVQGEVTMLIRSTSGLMQKWSLSQDSGELVDETFLRVEKGR